MKGIYVISIKFFMLYIFLRPVQINAQILKDTASLNLVKRGIENIYNLRFNEADEICTKLNESYHDHPVVYLLKGMNAYWENYPLLSSSVTRVSFENNMRKCIELCGEKHNPSDEAEFLLTNLSARGMLLMYYADNDLSLEVVPLAITTYVYIMRSFDYTYAYADFLFFTGLYSYYREAYPEAYPVYKTLAFLFPKGDKLSGIKQLRTVAKNSILFKAEAYSFLIGIYLTFENSYDQAYAYSKSLHELYPANTGYLANYIKNLLLVKHFDEAESMMKTSGPDISNSYYQAQLSIFNGILLEKKYHDIKLAEQYYIKGIRDLSFFGHFGDDFSAYGYFGLSRISAINGDKYKKKTYRKKAIELADFEKVNFD